MAEYAIGFLFGVAGVFFIVALANPDTPKTIAERGFFTHADQLYVVRPAEPADKGE